MQGAVGAVIGGFCFIVPGPVLIIALSGIFLAPHPPEWVLGATPGAGAAVPAVALNAVSGLTPASWKRVGSEHAQQARWVAYALVGGASTATVGPYLVLVLFACGLAPLSHNMTIESSSGRLSGPPRHS
jgi:chromate transporter